MKRIHKWFNALRDFINSRPNPIDACGALRFAGWSQSYRCEVSSLELPPDLPLHDAAKSFLELYGGLVIDVRGETTVLPAACGDDIEHIVQTREIDGRNYYPVGRIDDECATCILIDETGKLFLYIPPPGAEAPPWPVADFLAVIRFAMG